MEHAGNQLKKAIKERGLTQEQAAERLGITRQTIGQWIKRPTFDANTLHEIGSKLGIELEPESNRKSNNINLSREVFEKISQLIDTVCSQQNTIADQHRTIDRLVSNQKNSSDVRTADNADSAVAG